MAGVVYYKFKSSRDYSSIPMFGNFISVANLKTEIFQSNRLRRNTALILSNANSNEEYLDEDMLIPKHTSVIVRRVPGKPTLPIVVEKHKKKFIEDKGEATQANSSFDAAQSVLTTASTHLFLSPEKFIEDKVEALQANSGFDEAQSSVMKFPEELDLDDFGDDVYVDPKVLPVWSSNPVVDAPCPSETDEDSRIKALVNTPALNWQGPSQKGLCSGRDYGRGKGRRMMGAQGCGNSPSYPVVDAPCPSETDEDSRIKALVNTPALNWQRPSQKGLCFGRDYGRSKGRRMMGALGYGRAGLDAMTPPQGYVCHRCNISGHFIQHCPTNDDPNYDFKRVKSTVCPVAVLNEAAFEKEFEGLPSTKSVTNFPPELHCPMCKEVMKDAMLTRKCCFMSFCDRCIRNHIISNSMCFCGATNVLVDDLVPNVTLRETIISILENSGSMKNQGTDSACHEQSKLLSSTISFASSEDKISSPNKDGTLYIKERTDEEKDITNAPQSSLEDGTGAPVTLNKNDVLEELASNDPDGYNQGSIPRDLVPGDCMMSLCSSAYTPHGDNMPLGMDGYMACYFGVPSHWGYAAPYFNVPVGGPMSQDSFVGHWDSSSHQRDLSERTWMSNPIAKISEPWRKHKIKQHGERRCSGRQQYNQVNNSVDVSSMRSKSLAVAEHEHHNDQFHQAERSSMKRSVHKVEAFQLHERPYQYQNQDHHHVKAAADRKRNGSELSSTTFTGQDIRKKRALPPREAGNPNRKKLVSCSMETSVSNGRRKYRRTFDHNLSDDDDDDRNFKRKPSWYQSSLRLEERTIPI